jgi:two-component system cell cycle sensor histidine kinase/response regulator CckA
MSGKDNVGAPHRESVAELVLALAHDCNNLLAVAQLSARRVARTLDRGTPALGDLKVVLDTIDRMGVLMQRIRALSRPHDLALEALNLNDLVRYVSSILGPLFGDHVDLALELDPALPAIEADRLEMEQVLMNLLLNGREAIASEGRIVVDTTTIVIDGPTAGARKLATGAYVRLAVTDTGQGMTEAALAHVFEPFFTTKTAGEGSGLGLAGSRRIVERLGGSIFIKSDVGLGTRVDVFLPIHAPSAVGDPRTPLRGSTSGQRPSAVSRPGARNA